MRVKLCSALAVLALSAGPALGDAAWTSNLGPVIYDVDAADHVVLMHFTPGSGTERRTFIRGLVGHLGERGSYTGYWVETGNGQSSTPVCDVEILDAEGNATRNWGRVEFQVTSTGLPSAWTAQIGNCFDAPSITWSGYDDGNFDYESFERRRWGEPK
ncbi:hypothetical protein [Maricaulis sp.]|uniref:hypothetical protein n=1 Tax=Maricaulis sp. TaxID=1486257 RepID=UPI003A8CF7E9